MTMKFFNAFLMLHQKRGSIILLILCFFINTSLFAQSGKLRPGFDKIEYSALMHMHTMLYDSVKTDSTKPKAVFPGWVKYKSVYKSPVMGLDNRWELWKKDNENIAVINLRGTTQNPLGWLENFYAAMVTAQGELKLSNSFIFPYHLANNPRASVHIGWLVGMAFLARDIVPKIDSAYQTGVKNFLVMGHSQGGAISYLLTAHLNFLQSQNKLPKDIRFKTYSSASPKAGNTYFAYEYESSVDGGWGYNVVNSADWVPEVPFSVQTVNDFNNTNPFKNLDKVVKKQKLIARIALNHAYKKMKNPSIKAQKNYNKYLGGYATKAVRNTLPEFEPPVFVNNSNYVRIGPTIVLLADEAYYKEFPDSDQKIFIHHLIEPYLYLIKKYKY
jgi:hypothetical protein